MVNLTKKVSASIVLACFLSPGSSLASTQGDPALAFSPGDQIMSGLSILESSGNYAECNCDGRNSALGNFGIVAKNWVAAGYVTFPNGGNNWDNAVFTSKANALGVYDVDDLLKSKNGEAMQDKMATWLADDMYKNLNSRVRNAAKSGQVSVGGVPLTDSTLMAATWMMGPGAMNSWAASGFTLEGLKNAPGYDLAMAANKFTTAEQYYNHLIGRMATMEGVDFSPITGENVAYLECPPEMMDVLKNERLATIQNATMAADNPTTGFQDPQQSFGQLSCIEDTFKKGLDVMFAVPSLSGIVNSAKSAACEAVNSKVAEANSKVNESLGEMVNQSVGGDFGLGPISTNAGVSVGLGEAGENGLINTGVSDASVEFQTDDFSVASDASGGGYSGGNPSSGSDGDQEIGKTGLEGLFQEGNEQ